MDKNTVVILIVLALVPSASALGSCLFMFYPYEYSSCFSLSDPSACQMAGGMYFWDSDTCQPVCGNGHTEWGEMCDDGNTEDGDGCNSACEITSVCGNGIIEWGEICDDGNTDDGDGCSPACSFCRIFRCSDPAYSCDPVWIGGGSFTQCLIMGHTCNGGDDHDCDGAWEGEDCDDYNAAVHPGAAEIECNTVDEDCSGADSCGDIPVPEFPLEGLGRAIQALHGIFH
jgi:cysteine-rich repeat protein